MRILLINPRPRDAIRADTVLSQYMADYWTGQAERSRRHCVIYTREDYSEPVAVWHTRNQITLHFGDGDRG